MVAFLGFLALIGLFHKIDNSIWLTHSEYWVYPLQTLLCGLLLIKFWPAYSIERPRGPIFGLLVGIAVFLLWISPQAFLGFAPRTDGFNPISMFGNQAALYWPTVAFRFARLVLVVPLVEEIFWRGFILRYLIREDFDNVPMGTFSWLSFAVVTLAFAFSHAMPDWPAAIITGVLYNAVAYRTKSLATCVLGHATTNLLLGLWIMRTEQWGFW